MRQGIDEAKDLSGLLARMQRDARDLVSELRGIAEALRTAEAPEPHRAGELAREIPDGRDAELFAELAEAMRSPGERRFFLRR